MNAPQLDDFICSCSSAQATLIQTLLHMGQAHLFAEWAPDGEQMQEKRAFVAQLEKVDQSYPGGLENYIRNARTLLEEARAGLNPFEGCTPQAPALVDLSAFDAEYDRMEALGAQAFHRIGMVLVAGGLGERLGYSGIKLNIPVEGIEHTTYLQHYAQSMLAMEARMTEPRAMPLIIMTSEQTHARTLAVLEDHAYYGLQPDQVHLVQQERVPALSGNDARLALNSTYELQLKPHGHGDVHMLLHRSGLAAQLRDEGIRHLVFIQDTNGQVFNALPAAVGVSIDQDFDFNSLAVNRVPGEAVGGIARLVKGDEAITINVEYNQLDPLLRSTINPEGDVAGANGFSVFPGNINVLVIATRAYVDVLEKTRGIVAEFVNPKYTDASRSTFKKPTRLETLMQDLPKLFGSEQRTGVTVFSRTWCFSPNKNKVEDAAAQHALARPPESAATAESDFYGAGRSRLRAAGMQVEETEEQSVQGVPYTDGPRVLLRPCFAVTLKEVREKISGGHIRSRATLILDGEDIHLEQVTLRDQSALQVHACKGAKVTVRGELKASDGYEWVPLSDEEIADPATPETLLMRGYRYRDRGARVYLFDQPGDYEICL